MNKREWKQRALAAEKRLDLYQFPPLTFTTLTVCFSKRQVEFCGRTISADTDYVTFPVTNREHLLIHDGYWPVQPCPPTEEEAP